MSSQHDLSYCICSHAHDDHYRKMRMQLAISTLIYHLQMLKQTLKKLLVITISVLFCTNNPTRSKTLFKSLWSTKLNQFEHSDNNYNKHTIKQSHSLQGNTLPPTWNYFEKKKIPQVLGSRSRSVLDLSPNSNICFIVLNSCLDIDPVHRQIIITTK